jgi:hypothetical protein
LAVGSAVSESNTVEVSVVASSSTATSSSLINLTALKHLRNDSDDFIVKPIDRRFNLTVAEFDREYGSGIFTQPVCHLLLLLFIYFSPY